jgi:gentisate 1,2-dioxygenase
MLKILLSAVPVVTAELTCDAGSEPSCDAQNTTSNRRSWESNGEIYEYVKHSNPPMAEVPIRVFGPHLHSSGPSKVLPLDLREDLQVDHPATAPNLLANFVRINVGGDQVDTVVEYGATSQAFYVMRGSGNSTSQEGAVTWGPGDLFTLPYFGDAEPVCEGNQCVRHMCTEEEETGGCALYWVHDEPLLRYLGVLPSPKRFSPAFYSNKQMKASVDAIPGIDPATGEVKNRRGILLGNEATPQTKTLTPTMWSLLNVLAPKSDQAPHKHNSVALDLAVVGGKDKNVFTKIGRDLDANGDIVDPVIAEWVTNGVFVTPPGWWHSHHNLWDAEAWVLPIQDAGLYTHQRTLDIRFHHEEVDRLAAGRHRGATLPIQA